MKTVAWLFFLTFLLALPASAAEVSLQLPSDYKSSKIFSLEKITAFTFDFEGNYIVAEDIGAPATRRSSAIVAYRVSKVYPDGTASVLLDRTGQNITNLSYNQGLVYLVTRGSIYKISKGRIVNVISSLPTYGDYGNSNLIFREGFMYFAVGTATNSGIVGTDNPWLRTYPSVRDIPCRSIVLSGINAQTDNFLTEKKDDKANTGGFSTFNTPVSADQTVYGMTKCNGVLVKAGIDGRRMQVYAWGLHNPKGLSMDDRGQLWLLDGGMEDRGVRPIKNGKDAFYKIEENVWYGWPDFSAGSPVDQPAILAQFPNIPPKPETVMDLGKVKFMAISPEAFMFNSAVAQPSDDKLLRMQIGAELTDFLSVAGGKIIQYKFGPDDKLYVLVSTADGKTELHAIEPTTPLLSGAVDPVVRPKSIFTNWMVGIMVGVISSAGFFALRNLKRPIPPL